MKLKPLSNNVLVQRLEKEERTASGIIIPDSAKEKPQQAKVVAVGDGAINEKGEKTPVGVKVDDVVLIKSWGGDEVKLDGEEFLIIKDTDILAIVID